MTVSINPNALAPIVGPADAVWFQQSGTGAVPRSSQDKMRDVISVEDFGATLGNSATDVSAPFTKLRDYWKDTTAGVLSDSLDGFRKDRLRKKVLIPGGVHRITSGEALGDLFATSTLYGLTVEGVGPEGTVIYFDPPSLYDATGALTSATTTSGAGYKEVYLAAGASATNNIYQGWTFTATSGAANGGTATIVAYDGTTKKATLSHALTADPASADTYGIAAPLINSFNRMYGYTFRGITFQGSANAAKRNLFSQYSNGTAQDGMFERCEFTGSWSTLFFFYAPLGGSGNNSEVLWLKCAFTGTWQAALHTNVSDQLLNYWFAHCKYWTTRTWIRATKGSNFHVLHSDISVFGSVNVPADLATNPLYLFNMEGGNNGTQLFTFSGNRVECHNVNARIMTSNLVGGRVVFEKSHFTKQSAYGSTNAVLFNFNMGNFGPVVSWRDCLLLGTALFTYGTEVYRVGNTHSIRDCTHQLAFMPDEFITSSGGGNLGSQPNVDVRGWNTTAGVATQNRQYLGDGLVNGHVGSTVSRQRRSASLKNPQGSIPQAGSTITARLPLGATITGLHFHIPLGASVDSTPRTWLVKAGVASPTTIGTLTATPNAGVATFTSAYFECTSADLATITLEPQAGAPAIAGGQIAVDYLA